jgi:ATP-dependent protease ClpP protease subunit
MPIGVPRIIYSWGEELPAQWTDIYNFIFRRRMVFLMQYLDDELCNQICGLLINIHMEDRSKELEQNETESNQKSSNFSRDKGADTTASLKKNRSAEDLLNSDEDLGIDDIDTLEQLTLQKITKEWLNWNSQFFDYSDEPYLYYLAQSLSQDFNSDNNAASASYNFNAPQFFNTLKNNSDNLKSKNPLVNSSKGLDIYSAFRKSSQFGRENDYSFNQMHPLLKGSAGQRSQKKDQLLQMFQGVQGKNFNAKSSPVSPNSSFNVQKNKGISKFLLDLAGKDFATRSSKSEHYKKLSEKALGQRLLRREYNLDPFTSELRHPQNKKAWRSSSKDSYNEFRDYYRKQTERSFMEEETKKVFVIINSFGGSVGNGITVHDALQFIKAGSLTLGLGVAASASSLVLAGGTIGERYVTEGCHTMIHQPECVSPDHEVLTHEHGWIPINQVTYDHHVAILKEGQYLDYQKPTKIHTYDYSGPMYKVKNQQLNLVVTPNHRMYVATKNGDKPTQKYDFVEASSIFNQTARYKKDAIWTKSDYQFVLPAVEKLNTHPGGESSIIPDPPCFEETRGPKEVPMEPWLKFMGMWIAKGWTSTENAPDKHKYYALQLSQAGESGKRFLREVLSQLGLNWYEKVTQEDKNKEISGASVFTINNKQIHNVFSPLSKNPANKQLPSWVWELSQKQCEFLLEGLIAGDGHINNTDGTCHYFTSSIQLAKDLSRLALHAGYSSSYSLETSPSCQDTIRFLHDSPIKSEGNLWRINIIEKRVEPYQNYYASQQQYNDSFEPYTGKVHCLTVPGGVFYVQREGVPVWTGNSSLQGQASDIWIDSQEIMKIRLDVAEIYSLSTYRPRHKILRDLDRDFYLTAPETIAYGLADEIATNEVMHEIVEMTSKVWDIYDSKQQRLLESRESASSGSETQTQS